MNKLAETYEKMEELQIAGIENSTLQTRKDWTTDDWCDAVKRCPSFMEERDCPDNFTPEQWIELIIAHPMLLQFCSCENKLLPLLTEETFETWKSSDICQALFFDGAWLTPYLDLTRIEQEDFDNAFGGRECWDDAENFFDVMNSYFPTGIPEHLKLPFPRKGGNDSENEELYESRFLDLISEQGKLACRKMKILLAEKTGAKIPESAYFPDAEVPQTIQMLKLLVANGYDLTRCGGSVLHKWVTLDRITAADLAYLIAHGVPVDAPDPDGTTPLLASCHDNNFRHSTWLIRHGADVNSGSRRYGVRPLHLAVSEWHLNGGYCNDGRKLAELLLKYGATVDVRDRKGWTPLHRAVFAMEVRNAELLLEHGADVNAVSRDGKTPLHLLFCSGTFEFPKFFPRIRKMLRLLLKHGAKADCPDRSGRTALHYLCSVPWPLTVRNERTL